MHDLSQVILSFLGSMTNINFFKIVYGIPYFTAQNTQKIPLANTDENPLISNTVYKPYVKGMNCCCSSDPATGDHTGCYPHQCRAHHTRSCHS
jgi:hypothetical protein